MFFCRDHRDAVGAELGTSAPNVLSKALGDKWAATEERGKWERLSEQDKARHEKEMAVYDAELAKEEEEVCR